jgi:hypothetical protein
MNISPLSVATENQFNSTVTSNSIINNMDTYLKNLQLYSLLKNEVDINNNEFKKLLTDFEIKLFIENHNFFDDNQYNINILDKIKNLTKLEKQNSISKKIKEEYKNLDVNRKQKAELVKIENACFDDDVCFEGVKEKIAKGEEMWSTYSNNSNFVNAFKKYLNNQYGINFEAKNDKDARYTLGALPDSYKGGKYKRSKKRKLNRRKLTRRLKGGLYHPTNIGNQQGGLYHPTNIGNQQGGFSSQFGG